MRQEFEIRGATASNSVGTAISDFQLYTLAILKFLCKENAGAILKPLLISNE